MVVCLLGMLVWLPQHAHAQQAPGTHAFAGELIDAENTAISGVFRMTFHAYREPTGGTSLWQESQFVAVEGGMYSVALGEQTPWPTELNAQNLFIAVVLGGNEISRAPTLVAISPPPRSREQIIADLDIVYADLAERAVEAETATEADDCLRIGGLTLDEIDRYDELVEQIVGVREEVNRVTRPTMGRSTNLERIGGAGGLPYSRSCPPNHVVVGFRGGAGDLIDSIELICAPIE
jgi:hypothetical protein